VRVLLVRLGALGDIIHAVPAALALSAVPGAEIDWLVDPRHRAVLDLFDLPIRPIEVGRVTSGG
jgi:lipopolysaccharide heptosyltransferase I